jgi:hypothetical protein
MQVGMHLMMCGPCRRARRLMRFLREALGRLDAQLPAEQSLTPEIRARIKEALRRESPPNEKNDKSV